MLETRTPLRRASEAMLAISPSLVMPVLASPSVSTITRLSVSPER